MIISELLLSSINNELFNVYYYLWWIEITFLLLMMNHEHVRWSMITYDKLCPITITLDQLRSNMLIFYGLMKYIHVFFKFYDLTILNEFWIVLSGSSFWMCLNDVQWFWIIFIEYLSQFNRKSSECMPGPNFLHLLAQKRNPDQEKPWKFYLELVI